MTLNFVLFVVGFLMLYYCAGWLVPLMAVKILLLVVAASVTVYILTRKTLRPEPPEAHS